MKGTSLRRGTEKESCPFYNKDYHEIHTFLKCKDTICSHTITLAAAAR
jgi:hypothetical protein